MVPSSPTLAPTNSQLCAPYSTTNTNSGAQNYASCYVFACPGATITASGCATTYAGAACSGDQYLTLASATGVSVATNDDYCGLCSQLSYTVPSTSACQSYTLREGCYSSGSCTGTIRILAGRHDRGSDCYAYSTAQLFTNETDSRSQFRSDDSYGTTIGCPVVSNFSTY